MLERGDAETENRTPEIDALTPPRSKWTLTQEAFDKLLAALGPDRESAGEKYLELRAHLVRFFEWRGGQFPEEHADETINRAAKRVSEGEVLENPAGYLFGVARMLLLEIHKERVKQSRALGELSFSQSEQSYQFEELEPRVECLKKCLETLSAENRELILSYYQGEKGLKIENRKRLSDRLNVSLNTLRMRAQRLRERLQACVADCLQGRPAQL